MADSEWRLCRTTNLIVRSYDVIVPFADLKGNFLTYTIPFKFDCHTALEVIKL